MKFFSHASAPLLFSIPARLRLILLLTGGLSSSICFSQRGKDGAKVVSTLNNIVNEYTALTANAAAGATTITVAASTLNANGRFTGNLAPGDLIMIIQMQGATIRGGPSQWVPTSADPNDSTWGEILNYNNCGNWELAEVYSVPNGTSITLDCPLNYNYTAAGRVQVVRIPRYTTLNINAGGEITCDSWNGTIGGICAIEVLNTTTINAGGEIDATGKGFRGGQLNENLSALGYYNSAVTNADGGAEKGEGIAGFQNDYTPFGGMYGFGPAANSGGGGNGHNGGGAGGGNGGNPLTWNGHGIPNVSTAGWINAWNLHYTGFATQTSSGGGQGGYTFSGSNGNATTQAPGNNGAWGGDSRRRAGGLGGRPLDYSTGRLFLAGGGGSGDQNNNDGGVGGNGGGLIYLMNYGTVSGAGQIISHGNIGGNTTGGSPGPSSYTGNDAAGGGGAGGTLIINSVGTLSGISLAANGGNGGNQILIKGVFITTVNEAEGPGGGGGGGYIAISNGAPAITANGGTNGTTNSDGLTEFPHNGATSGGAGTTNGAVTNFIINSPNVTICAGQSATLTATTSGTVPAGTTIIWYDQLVAGNNLGTGNTYTTTVLPAGTYTYYVGTCPGTYHQPVVVNVVSSPTVTAGADVTICSSSSTTLSASGGTGYVWSPTTGLNNPNISNPTANPVSTTTYVVTVTTACGPVNDSVIVNVTSSSTASIAGNNTICAGASTTLTASGGGNYSWTTGSTSSSITVAPTSTTSYSVIVGSGSCSDTAGITVTVSSGIIAGISGNTTICPGTPTTLTASGGTNYSWNTSATTSAITVSPTTNTTYSVIASSGTCVDTASITITISNNITASISGNTTICPGSPTTLTASGGNNYSWNTSATTSAITVSPTGTTTYSVIASSGTCVDTASIVITVSNNITANVSGTTTICTGGSAVLSASGGTNYSWTTGSTASSVTVFPTSNTTYSVIVSSGTCADTASITVTIGSGITASITGNTTVCAGNSATLTATGGSSYSWSTTSTNATIVVSPTSSTSYSVIASSGTCTDTASILVTLSAGVTASVTGTTALCAGETTTLTASGGSIYSWSNGAITSSISVTPPSNTTYSVIVSNGNCTDTASVLISVSSATVIISGTSAVCQGNSAVLTASGGGTYLWSTGETTATINPSASGTYSVLMTIGTCTAAATQTFTIYNNPTVNVSASVTIVQGQTANLSASGGTAYSWSDGSNGGSITVSPNSTTVYCVTGYDINGCYDTACTMVYIELCANAGELYLPNAFSPNGDGENDYLQVYFGSPLCIKSLKLIIYNRWGELIYKTTDPAFKWNGIYSNGMLSNMGISLTASSEVFVYYLDAELADKTVISRKGNISVVR